MTISDVRATQLARLGFAARGLVYCLVAWFAVDAAMRGGTIADNQGAIGSLADEQLGAVLLAVIAAGLLGYAVWRLTEAIADPEQIMRDAKGALTRIGHVVSGIAHLILAWSAARLAWQPRTGGGGQSPGDESARDWTGWLLSVPFGRVLVALVAIGILTAAVMQAKKAWKGDFVKDLHNDGSLPSYVCTMGRLGYGARAVVFTIIAGFFRGRGMAGACDRSRRHGGRAGDAAGPAGGQMVVGRDGRRAGIVRRLQLCRSALSPRSGSSAGLKIAA
ncbi:DUF1206 domain-containing protein [Sphingomonas sp. Ant20]|uniref:DUF1206 domain-containing protein n=1 Tax=Sphingomonas sp. Ant20 TaxID=104605 RepID=UPI00069044B1|nr:DUF1206 domain-containing protein [Sphingomonas sp. Ant20]